MYVWEKWKFDFFYFLIQTCFGLQTWMFYFLLQELIMLKNCIASTFRKLWVGSIWNYEYVPIWIPLSHLFLTLGGSEEWEWWDVSLDFFPHVCVWYDEVRIMWVLYFPGNACATYSLLDRNLIIAMAGTLFQDKAQLMQFLHHSHCICFPQRKAAIDCLRNMSASRDSSKAALKEVSMGRCYWMWIVQCALIDK